MDGACGVIGGGATAGDGVGAAAGDGAPYPFGIGENGGRGDIGTDASDSFSVLAAILN